MSEVVTFCLPDAKNIVKSRSDIEGKTTQEILELLKTNESCIFYHCPLFEQLITDEKPILVQYPGLLMKERCDPFTRPEQYVSIKPVNYSSNITLYIQVSVSNYDNFPSFPITLREDFYKTNTWEQFRNEVEKSFSLKTESFKLLLGSRVPPSNQSIEFIIKYLDKSPVKIECTLTEKEVERCDHRKKILNEILSTEETYIASLKELITFWKPNLDKILDSFQCNTVFGQIPVMINCHETFMKQLKSKNPGYSTMISDILMEFSDFFKISSRYISSYPKIRTIMQEKYNENKSLFDSLQVKSQPIFNLLITPIQRVPRYILFIRELQKFTPEFHPDSELLDKCREKYDKVTREIEQQQTESELLEKASLLHEAVKPFQILVGGRRLLKFCEVSINRPKKLNGAFYVFNDIIIVTEIDQKKNRENLLYNVPLDEFAFTVGEPDENSINFLDSFDNTSSLFGDSRNFVNITFKDSDFLSINSAIENLLEVKGDEIAQWKNIQMLYPAAFAGYGHSAYARDGKVYIYGGHNGQKPISFLYMVDLETKTATPISTKSTKMIHRWGHALAEEEDGFLISGGCTRSHFLTDIWRFSVTKSEWSNVQTKTPLEGALGRSMCLYSNKLFLFGGRTKKSTTDTTAIVYLENGTLTTHEFANRPTPRYFHTATVYLNSMYVIGGRDDDNILGDAYRFDLINFKWEKLPFKVSPRYGHQALLLGHFLYLIGGVDGNGQFTERVNLLTSQVIPIPNSGTCPRNLMYFSAVMINDKDALVIDGCESDRKYIFPGVRSLTLPPCEETEEEKIVTQSIRNIPRVPAPKKVENETGIAEATQLRKISFTKIVPSNTKQLPRLDSGSIAMTGDEMTFIPPATRKVARVSSIQSIDLITNSESDSESESDDDAPKVIDLISRPPSMFTHFSSKQKNMVPSTFYLDDVPDDEEQHSDVIEDGLPSDFGTGTPSSMLVQGTEVSNEETNEEVPPEKVTEPEKVPTNQEEGQNEEEEKKKEEEEKKEEEKKEEEKKEEEKKEEEKKEEKKERESDDEPPVIVKRASRSRLRPRKRGSATSTDETPSSTNSVVAETTSSRTRRRKQFLENVSFFEGLK